MGISMARTNTRCLLLGSLFLLAASWLLPARGWAKNDPVMGKVVFAASTRAEKTSGVWVDGQYVGYVHELKGSKSLWLLPGDHTISVRQDGYQNYTQQVDVQPGQTSVVTVAMAKAPAVYPHTTATVKIDVDPSRAAVFVDGLFVGHSGEFNGPGRGLLVAPGEHHIKIALPGYQIFETDINPIANQKVEVKTTLARTDAPLSGPLVENSTATPANRSASLSH